MPVGSHSHCLLVTVASAQILWDRWKPNVSLSMKKTLWRGGPNTAKGADYYWNVNKQSAHLLDEIRKAFTEGDQKKAEMLTRQNFNSEVSYEADGENPFRFGSFTTMGEFYVETGLNMIGMSDYKRILSLDSAMAVVQFKRIVWLINAIFLSLTPPM